MKKLIFIILSMLAILRAEANPPSTQLIDQAGVLYAMKDEASAFEARLQKIKSEYKVPFYVILQAGILEGNVHTRSAELQRKWSEIEECFVIVFDVDTREFGIGVPGKSSDNREKKSLAYILPNYIIHKCARNISLDEDPAKRTTVDQFFFSKMNDFFTGLERDLQSETTTPAWWQSKKLLLSLLSVAIGIIALSLIAGYLRRKENKNATQPAFYFPKAHALKRLEAHQGGGRTLIRAYNTRG